MPSIFHTARLAVRQGWTPAIGVCLAACMPMTDLDGLSSEYGSGGIAIGGTSSENGAVGGQATGGINAASSGGAGSLAGGGTGNEGAGGGVGGEGSTGGTLCAEPMIDCDANPNDCETNRLESTNHCGECDNECPGEHDVCEEGECVTPCLWETATDLGDPNTDSWVPANGCVAIKKAEGNKTFLFSEVPLSFTYIDECGVTDGEGDIPYTNGTATMDSCVILIDLDGPSSITRMRWWTQD